MANIKLRQSQLSETQSVGSTVKASTLTYQDLDDNFNNLNNALMAPVFGNVAATGILTVDTINPTSISLPLTLNNIRIDSLEASGNYQGYALYNMVGSPTTAQLRPNECVTLRYDASGTDTVTLDDYRANYHLIRWSGTAGADVLTIELPDPDPTKLSTNISTILKRFVVIICYKGSNLDASDSVVWSPLGSSTLKWPGDVTPTPKFSSNDVDIYEFIQIDNVTLGSVWGFAGSTGPEGISEASYYDNVSF